jgi:L,D-peptidoglycan transpeptidase YkuD (ErfK/YbiS/YcfS/YnhG family)
VRRSILVTCAGVLVAATATALVTPGLHAGSASAARVRLVSSTKTLPQQLASTGGGTQLITAVTSGSTNASRDGKVIWWQKKGSSWVEEGSTNARFGTKGLSDNRLEGDLTTPTGIYTLPLAFGIKANNPKTKLTYHKVDSGSWWDENSLDAHYNTWYENCPSSICWDSSKAHSSEHLANYSPQYNYAIFIGFNAGSTRVRPPARPSGSGIFLHVNGSGHTAGCISISQVELEKILSWIDPKASPHIVIGNAKSVYRF